MHLSICRCFALSIIITVFIHSPTFAANLAGVMGPNVKPGHQSVQLRVAMSPSEVSGMDDHWAYLLHYQKALNKQWQARLVTAFSDKGDFQYNFSRLEILWNLRDKNQGMWSTGLRFDIRQRRGTKPEEVAMLWANEWHLAEQLRVRAVVRAASDFNGATTGQPKLFTRMEISKPFSGIRYGLELFNNYGRLSNLDMTDQHKHQLGPSMVGKVAGFKYHVRYLAGIGRGAPEHDFLVRFTKAF